MKKALIIIAIVIVIAAATVLGLFAAGVFSKKTAEPIAYAMDASKSEPGVLKGLSTDAYFDIRAERDPSAALDNYVIIRDNRGNRVTLKSTRQGDGVYRITARDGFKPRSSYQIWVTGASFAAEAYKDLDTIIFMTAGEEVEKVELKSDIAETKLEGTTVVPVEVGKDVFYTITLPEAAASRYQPGQVILAKKPAAGLFSDGLEAYYTGDIEGYKYNGMAAYTVVSESEVKDGREEVYCRLAKITEVFTDIDIFKTLPLDENNFSVDEEKLQEALDKSEFTAAVYEAALETFDLFSGEFKKTVKDSPKMVAEFKYNVEREKIQLDFYFTITLAKGMDLVFAVKNTIYITPNINFDYNISTDLDLQLDLGVNIKTKTVCSVDMETSDAKIQAKTMEEFKKKFTELVEGKTTEKSIVGAELPIYSYKYPIYCFVLGIEFGVDIDLGIKAQVNFEYDFNSDITVGVTYVNGDFDTYKSVDTSSSAKDLVLLGKIKASAGVYVKLTASLLEVAGVGFKVSTGAYANLAGQLRLDMKAALEDKSLHVIKGYYVDGGLYLGLTFELKAGFDLPVVGYKGWQKSWELKRWEYPLFEFGSKYLVQSLVNDEIPVEIYGKTAELKTVKVNAFDLYTVSDANAIDIGIDSFDIEYIDDAADYITFEDGRVTVNPTVGSEFEAKVKIIAKSDSYVTGTIVFHKAAVMPTCAEATLTFDKKNPADVTFDVASNQSAFIELTGEGITANYYVAAGTGAITIYKSFLSDLAVGEYTFTYVSDKGRLDLTVNVVDTTPISAKNGKTNYTFLKSNSANAVYSLVLSGSKVTEIEGLQKGEYSVDSMGTLVIYASALINKAPDTYAYTVKASNGSSLGITVTVVDDRLPVVPVYSFSFGKNAGVKSDVTIPFTAYGYTLGSVEGNSIKTGDYAISDGYVTIKQAYLAGLDQGDYDFRLRFANGTSYTNPTVTIKVKDSATIVAIVSSATFDKCNPTDVEFKIFSTAAIELGGNGLTKEYYTVSGSSVTISKSFLSKKSVGNYEFTATAGNSSERVSLEIIDTTVPEIETAQGGVMALTYDKAKSGDRFFEMLLAGADFDKLDGADITDEDYTVALNGTKTKITLLASYLDSLRVGTYEFNVLTSVNVSTLVLTVDDSRTPELLTDASLEYTKGTGANKSVSFANYDHTIKSIEVKGGSEISMYSGDCDFDVKSGVFTVRSSYLETLSDNTYVTLILTFDDEASSTRAITIAVKAAL